VFADAIAAAVFSSPQAAPVLRAMAPTLVVGAASAAAIALLSRDLEFKVIQLAGLGSYIVGYLVVGVTAALNGLGVWSLVLAWHVQTALACLVMLAKAPRSLRPANPFRPLPIARFGATVMTTNMVNWVIESGPHTAIGRWLGAASLGLYTVANNLVKVPADHLVRNLQAVLFPLASRAQNNDAGLKRAYLTVLAGIGVLTFPVFTFVAVLSEPIVALLLGQKWLAAAPVLVPISLAMILHAVEAMSGPILGGRGEPMVELRIKLGVLALTLVTLVITAQWSLVAVAWGVAFVFLVRWIWMNAAVTKRLKIGLRAFFGAMLGPFVLGLIAAAVPLALMAGLRAGMFGLSGSQGWPPVLAIVTAALITAAVIAAAMLAAPRLVFGTYLLALVQRLFDRKPALAARAPLRPLAAAAAAAARELA
jgi:lipopolysaccharide exporter